MNLKVLKSTNNLSREEWLELRKSSIGGSDAASILGFNPWKSAIDVWMEKTGRSKPIEDNERMRIGRDLEEYVAKRFEEETGRKVRRKNAVLVHPEHEWMTANVDRLIVGEDTGLECKVTNSYAASDWKDGCPLHYQFQCHHYMAVTGASGWWIAALVGNEKIATHFIERDEDVIQSLTALEKDYWETYITKDEMPPPDGSSAAQDAIKELYPMSAPETFVELPKDVACLLDRRYELGDVIEKMSKEVEEIEQRIQVMMGENEAATAGGWKLTWKSRTQARVDSKKLKAEQPELYEKYTKESSFRVFTVRPLLNGK